MALCDNKYQGIVPVPAAIGDGQDAKKNLYWGAGYGVKTYFSKKTNEWQLVTDQINPEKNILERLVFKHVSKEIYLMADAYDGQYIKQTTIDFLNAAAGNMSTAVKIKNKEFYFGGSSGLVAYVGHDGLMDFTLTGSFKRKNEEKRETIILACYSKKYFSEHLRVTGASPLLWSTGLMAPEAYILHDAVSEWTDNKTPAQVRMAAAKAYSKYQKCTVRAAQNLLVTGW